MNIDSGNEYEWKGKTDEKMYPVQMTGVEKGTELINGYKGLK